MLEKTSPAPSGLAEELVARIGRREAVIGVIGLGYVGLPLCCAAAAAGFKVLGFDINPDRADAVNRKTSYLETLSDAQIATQVEAGRLSATADLDRLVEADAVLICVPTPVTAQREPDLSYVVETSEQIAKRLRRGQLVVLESTTWPGTTVEIVAPILERTGLRAEEDFFLAFSPEREDPGNKHFTTSSIPKVVGGTGPGGMATAEALYTAVIDKVVAVSSASTAEAVKLTENIFRAVNIALVNELKVIYDAMGIDVWEVIEAAKSKPFGFMPFYPGPGLGGHCIPIDPFYLTWKAREYGLSTRFIELAGEINVQMPHYVVSKLREALDRRHGRGLNGSRILVVGLAYKKNVNDTRESPAFKLIQLLEDAGAGVDYADPFVPVVPRTREHAELAGRRSIDWSSEGLSGFDAAVIVTDHDSVDYRLLADTVPIVVDTRNALGARGIVMDGLVKA